MIDAAVIEFLLDGDPVIRWQTMRDLLDVSPTEWEAERARIPKEGWGAKFLAGLQQDGNWPDARWTGNVWTLVQLVELGFPQNGDMFRPAFERVVRNVMPRGEAVSRQSLLKDMDLCHLGFWLRIGTYFWPDDERLAPLANTLLSVQFADGGWNCRMRMVPKTSHGSFHTTFNVLEGLREAAKAGIISAETFERAQARGIEFMVQHKMYRSDRTGEIVSDRFLHLSYPSYWHYTVLRGLDYMRNTPAIKDPRLEDPLSVIAGRRKPYGRWIVEKRIPGETLFDMEKMGQDSRWNTLRALRVLRAAGRL